MSKPKNNDVTNSLSKAARKGTINALKSLGADAENQQEMQKDFHFLRNLRKRSEERGYSAMRTIFSIGIGAAIMTLWEGIKSSLKN